MPCCTWTPRVRITVLRVSLSWETFAGTPLSLRSFDDSTWARRISRNSWLPLQAGGVMHEACSTEGIWPLPVRAFSTRLSQPPSSTLAFGSPVARHGTSCPMLIPGLVRRFLGTCIRGQGLFHVPLPVAHIATGCWALDLIARRARLSLLVSLAAHGPDGPSWRPRLGQNGGAT